MQSLYPHEWQSYLRVFLVFLRFTGLFLFLPVFSHRAIPPFIKLFVALSISLAIYPLVGSQLGVFSFSVGGMLVSVIREIAVGCLMGFAAYVTFEAIHLAAQFVGLQMGFGTATLLDPQSQASVSVLVPLHGWLAILACLATDMHHTLIAMFVKSFEMTSHISSQSFAGLALAQTLIGLGGKLFILAVRMAAPFTLLMLVVNVAMGVLSRVLPQMNLLLFAFPITILLGLAGLYLVAPDLLIFVDAALAEATSDVMLVLSSL